MQVELSTVATVVSWVVSAAVAIVVTLAKLALNAKESEMLRRITSIEADIMNLEKELKKQEEEFRALAQTGDKLAMDRLHMLELGETKTQGALALLRGNFENFSEVAKDRISNVEKLLGSRARSYQEFPVTRVPSTPIPPKEK